MNLEILNPLEYPGWDELLLTNEHYSFFHSSSWARVLCESYGYKPLYFSSIDDGKLLTLVPIMEVNSLLTGRRGVSLPFTDFCEPIVSDKAQFHEIVDRITEYGKKAGWKYIEWRGGETYFDYATPSSSYRGHTLELTRNAQELLKSFRRSTSRNIRKAIKHGVDTEISNSLEAVKAFYRLHCSTRKYHGLPPQPYSFFKKLHEHAVSKNKGFVILARYQQREVAGAVFLHLGNKAIFKFGASERTSHCLRPNNLVMWEAIKGYAGNGFMVLDFGRAELENTGLLQFKRGWGTEERFLKYYKYDLRKEAFIEDHSKIKVFRGLFDKMPTLLLRILGSVAYKYIG